MAPETAAGAAPADAGGEQPAAQGQQQQEQQQQQQEQQQQKDQQQQQQQQEQEEEDRRRLKEPQRQQTKGAHPHPPPPPQPAARPPEPPPPQQQQPAPDPSLQILLETRVCGSPAVDGYANVKPECLFASPTARWYRGWVAGGGDPAALVAHLEAASDIDGIAVKWGIGNKHDSAEGCARDCWAHRPGQVDGPFKELPCNAFSWCGAPVCFEPDAHNHTQGDCWLKWAEAPASPELNMRGDLPPDYRKRHPTAPPRAQWVAGVLLPPGVGFTNGSWSPRWAW